MAIVNGEQLEKVELTFPLRQNGKVIIMGIFSAEVRYGHVSKTGQEAFMGAVIYEESKKTVVSGWFYDNKEQAMNEAFSMLKQKHEESEKNFREEIAKMNLNRR